MLGLCSQAPDAGSQKLGTALPFSLSTLTTVLSLCFPDWLLWSLSIQLTQSIYYVLGVKGAGQEISDLRNINSAQLVFSLVAFIEQGRRQGQGASLMVLLPRPQHFTNPIGVCNNPAITSVGGTVVLYMAI